MVINQIQAQEKAYHSVALLKDNKQTKNDDNKTLFIERDSLRRAHPYVSLIQSVLHGTKGLGYALLVKQMLFS